MGGELRYEIGQNAYIKLVLHALKHKTAAVNGVLLGRLSGGDAVEIADAVPSFHSHLGLLPSPRDRPSSEEYYGAQGMYIVGYFHANERFNDFELSNVARNIGDHVHRYFPQAALILVETGSFTKGEGQEPVMQLYTKDSSKSWKLVGSDGGSRFSTKEPSANVVLWDYISTQKWQDVVDFDDHLDDISKDWLNPELFK
ncbi:uncharacterized protein family [Actinidia rufa]|uniref:Uncharacterized protein family n=1 Tax=Actinidia rufa TaxID=165716 RepID=A0A7J0G980_9ERIC|nr:uncharacterized protein family [Actinidia rufa]